MANRRTWRPITIIAAWAVAFSIVALPGCGDGRPTRVPVSGQVLLDGKPLSYGVIRLIPENDRPASAKLDSEGRFTLKTFEDGDGAVLGTHSVAIRACELLNATTLKWHAPKNYADESTSGLTATISDSNEPLVINLSWNGGKPFVEHLINGQWQ